MRGRENKWERAPCLSGRLGASGPQTTRGSARGCLRAACAAWTATERAAEPGHHGRGFSAWAGGRSPLGHVPASGLWEGHGSSEVTLDQRASRPVPLPASPQLCLAGPPCPARGAPRQACPSAGARALGRSPRSAASGEQRFLRASYALPRGEPASAHRSPPGSLRTGPPGPHRGPPGPPGPRTGPPGPRTEHGELAAGEQDPRRLALPPVSRPPPPGRWPGRDPCRGHVRGVPAVREASSRVLFPEPAYAADEYFTGKAGKRRKIDSLRCPFPAVASAAVPHAAQQ